MLWNLGLDFARNKTSLKAIVYDHDQWEIWYKYLILSLILFQKTWSFKVDLSEIDLFFFFYQRSRIQGLWVFYTFNRIGEAIGELKIDPHCLLFEWSSNSVQLFNSLYFLISYPYDSYISKWHMFVFSLLDWFPFCSFYLVFQST